MKMTCSVQQHPNSQPIRAARSKLARMRDAGSEVFRLAGNGRGKESNAVADLALDAFFHRLPDELVNLQTEPHVEAVGENPLH